jgi:nicotinamidase-related amidase
MKKIKKSTNNNGLALMLIDMQYNFLNTRKEKIIPNQVKVIKFFKEHNIPLIIIESAGCGAIHSDLEQEIARFPKKLIRTFSKYDHGGFTNQQLHAYLAKNSIKKLLLMGVNGCVCVYETAVSALMYGYKIITSRDLLHGFYKSGVGFSWYEENGILKKNYKELLTVSY